MEKNNEFLTINKYNYKGYAELYDIKKNNVKEIKKIDSKIEIFGLVDMGTLAITIANLPLSSIGLGMFSKNITLILCGSEILSFITFWLYMSKKEKKINDLTQKEIDLLIEKFPYVDMSIEEAKLMELLAEYKENINVEEMLGEYLEETKYDSYMINPPVFQEELDKPKIRQLTR